MKINVFLHFALDIHIESERDSRDMTRKVRYDASFATASASPPIFAAPPTSPPTPPMPPSPLGRQEELRRRLPSLHSTFWFVISLRSASRIAHSKPGLPRPQTCASLPPRPTPPLRQATPKPGNERYTPSFPTLPRSTVSSHPHPTHDIHFHSHNPPTTFTSTSSSQSRP